jgi:two-component system, OmpR family, sensor histidine kinase CiaH
MNNSYKKERLKLTALYFGIIFLIVFVFSFIVLQTQNQQFLRFDPGRGQGTSKKPYIEKLGPTEDEIIRVNTIISEIKAQNLKTIVVFDLFLLLFASFLSYYLSGKTLEPILATLNKQKRFISDASHELKTPITNIMTEAQVLNRSKKSTLEEYKEFTNNVIVDAKHLNELVTFLLDSARLENHSLTAEKSEVDLVALSQEMARKFKERAKLKNVTIDVRSEGGVVATTDPSLLQRLLSILIDNALKYNKEEGIIIIKPFYNSSKLPSIEVKDTGVGIDEKDIPKLFDRFYRVSEDRNVKGFGLGLSIAKQLADLLNIEINTKSQVGEGTAFTLTLR